MTEYGNGVQRQDDVLVVRRLSIHFGETRVLTDLSFRVPRGTSLAIIGPNGAGKTVLFKALIGSIPFEGDVRWAPGIRIGYVPQKLDLERDVPITGLDFLRARAALARESDVDVSHALVSPRRCLPKRRRATDRHALGRTVPAPARRVRPCWRSDHLLLDEPTAGVDEPGQERLNELVHRLQHDQGLTVLFISHELTVVYRYATTVPCLSRGQACMGSPRTILTPELLRELYGTPVDYHVHDE